MSWSVSWVTVAFTVALLASTIRKATVTRANSSGSGTPQGRPRRDSAINGLVDHGVQIGTEPAGVNARRECRGFCNDGARHKPARLNGPKAVAVSTAGHVYIADSSFNNFQIFDPDGRREGLIPVPGSVNFAFAGDALYITNDTAIWKADLQ